MSEADDLKIVEELMHALNGSSIRDADPKRIKELTKWLGEHVPSTALLQAPDAAWTIVFAAAMRQPKVVETRGGSRSPLLGAKHLLALSEYDVYHPTALVQDTSQSMEHFWIGDGIQAVRKHPAEHAGLRQRIASEAAGHGSTRKSMTLSGGGLSLAAAALWESIQELATDRGLALTMLRTRKKVGSLKRAADQYEIDRDASQHLADGVPVPRQQRTWRNLASYTAAALGATALVIIAVLAYPSMVQKPLTGVTTYVPTDTALAESRSLKVEEGLQVPCSQTSLISIRQDAHLCLVAGIVVDPCFEIESERVVCPRIINGKVAESQVYRIAEVREFSFDAARVNRQVGLEDAQTQLYPWALVLDERDSEGRPYECVTAWSDDRFALGSYKCNQDSAPEINIVAPKDTDAGVIEIGGINVTTDGTRSAGSLEWADGVATVEFADATTGQLKTVRVLAAWF